MHLAEVNEECTATSRPRLAALASGLPKTTPSIPLSAPAATVTRIHTSTPRQLVRRGRSRLRKPTASRPRGPASHHPPRSVKAPSAAPVELELGSASVGSTTSSGGTRGELLHTDPLPFLDGSERVRQGAPPRPKPMNTLLGWWC